MEISAKALFRKLQDARMPYFHADEARAQIRLLFDGTFGISPIDLMNDKTVQVDDTLLETITKKLKTSEPVQYIIGHVDFAGCRLQVGPSVLIPRPETEELVNLILKNHHENNLLVLDACTGSGCIAIAMSKARPTWQISAIDMSEEALKLATSNNSQNQTNVSFYMLDILNEIPVERKLDILVSNPPYVDRGEEPSIAPHVLRHEPEMALFAPEGNPLAFYRELESIGRTCLRPGGSMYLEINSNYAQQAIQLFKDDVWAKKQLIEDGIGNLRFLQVALG